MSNLIGSVLLQYETQNKRELLLTITEINGNIFVNGIRLGCGMNVEGSIRFFGNVKAEFNLFTTYFQVTPANSAFIQRNFLHCWWEDFAISKAVVAATVIVTKMDYESGYDSLG